MNKDKIIDYFVEQIGDWGLDDLIYYAQSKERERLLLMTETELQKLYKEDTL